MATQMITLKLNDKFLKDIDEVVKKGNYQNRTEFIRASLRENVDEAKLKAAMESIKHLKGAAKRKTSPEEYEEMRRKGYEKFSKRFK